MTSNNNNNALKASTDDSSNTEISSSSKSSSSKRPSSKRLLQFDIEKAKGYVKLGELNFPDNISEEWELDCYSRPVTGDDKRKLWEVILTDTNSDFKYIKSLPSNLVNSRNLRKIVEEVMEESPVRPKTIRFFRNQMYNMITIALSTLDVDVKPSRRCHNLFMLLNDREANIYPNMKGYNPQLRQSTILDMDISQPDRLPDVLKCESYAFVALPAEVFYDGQVNVDNIGRGKMCPIEDLPKEGFINGITLFSQRADAVAAWMSGVELSSIEANLLDRELILNSDINTQYMVAPLMEAQKKEAQIFEKGKANQNGFHFLSIQFKPESEDVEGFWLLRQFDDEKK